VLNVTVGVVGMVISFWYCWRLALSILGIMVFFAIVTLSISNCVTKASTKKSEALK